MNPIILIFSFYVGLLVSKYLFLIVIRQNDTQYYIKNNKQIAFFLLLPYLLFTKIIKNKDVKNRKFDWYSILTELLGGFSFALFCLSLYKIYTEVVFTAPEIILHLAIFLFFYISLLYLSVYDIVTFSIPEQFVRSILFLIVLINLIIGLIRFLYFRFSGSQVLEAIHVGYLDNLAAGIIAGLLIYLIIKLSKNKGMGTGDIDIMVILGLILGWPAILSSFFLTLIIGSIIAIIYATKAKKFHNLLVPFVPFLFLGFVIALGFGRDLVYYIFSINTIV